MFEDVKSVSVESLVAQGKLSRDQVVEIQKGLKELGLYNHKPDGIFGRETAHGVREYYRRWNENVPLYHVSEDFTKALKENRKPDWFLPCGSAGAGTVALSEESAAEYCKAQVKKADMRLVALGERRIQEGERVGPGASRAAITALQVLLYKCGYDLGEVDGKWGRNTQAALLKFQRENGVKGTGVCGSTTYKRLIEVMYSNRDFA